MNILFICSRNKWRSKTAEDIFKDVKGLHVRSAGTEATARIKVNEGLLKWAELIFVMERHHKQKLNQRYSSVLSGKKLIVLDIADEYQYMDAELIEMLKIAVEPYLC